MAASDYVPNFFKNRLHLAGRPQMARTDVGSQTAHVGDGCARQQDGADCVGASCKARGLPSSGRSQRMILADLKSSEM